MELLFVLNCTTLYEGRNAFQFPIVIVSSQCEIYAYTLLDTYHYNIILSVARFNGFIKNKMITCLLLMFYTMKIHFNSNIENREFYK